MILMLLLGEEHIPEPACRLNQVVTVSAIG
jgi:hypothetical protein